LRHSGVPVRGADSGLRKVWAWAATGSIALLTSAADGLVDVLASMVTLIGVRYALRPADKGHRYGHGKAEAVAAFVQALLLGAAGLVLGGESIGRIINPQPLAQLGLGIWVIIGSSIAATGLVLMQTYVVKRTGSTAIAADRAHYVTDVAVNIAVLVALILERHLGWTRSDSIGALLISFYMIWNARGMAADALKQLLDRELDIVDRKRVKAAVLSVEGVRGVHDIRTRNGGDRVFVEFPTLKLTVRCRSISAMKSAMPLKWRSANCLNPPTLPHISSLMASTMTGWITCCSEFF
jgi:ferrous-iron efflux pump FieF